MSGNPVNTDAIVAHFDRIVAERDALYDALERLVVERKGNEFATPQQHASLRNAKALLAEIRPTPKDRR